MVAPLVVAAGVAAAATLADQLQRRKEAAAARKAQDRLAEEFRNIPAPELQGYDLERYKDTLDYTPEELAIAQQQQSELGQYQGDPRLQQAQMGALGSLQGISEEGLTAEDLSGVQDIQTLNAAETRGREAALMQGLQRRGLGGSGQEQAQRMLATQAGADRSAADSRDLSRESRARALQAMQMQGQLAGNIRGQGFSEAQARASASDRINQFNIANQNRAAAQNWEASNRAANQAAVNRQNIASSNVDLANQQAGQANTLAQKAYQNQIQRAVGATGQGAMANQMRETEAKRASEGRMTAATAGIGAGTAWASQPEEPEANTHGVQPLPYG